MKSEPSFSFRSERWIAGAGRRRGASQVPCLARELRVAGRVEDVRDGVQALPDGRLPVEREDAGADVGREPLADEDAVPVRAVDLPGEVVEQVRDRRCDALEVVAVA
jgi:hypothetical protein